MFLDTMNSIVKCPYQPHPEISRFHGVPVGGKIVVADDPQTVEKIIIGYKKPGPLDTESEEHIQKRIPPHIPLILQVKYASGRHVPTGPVTAGGIQVKSQLTDQGPLEKRLLDRKSVV